MEESVAPYAAQASNSIGRPAIFGVRGFTLVPSKSRFAKCCGAGQPKRPRMKGLTCQCTRARGARSCERHGLLTYQVPTAE